MREIQIRGTMLLFAGLFVYSFVGHVDQFTVGIGVGALIVQLLTLADMELHE